MANEKRLIDANAFLEKLSRMIDYCKNDSKVDGLTALFQVGDAIIDCKTVDAVEVVQFNALKSLVNGEWVDCKLVQEALDIDFATGLKLFDFSRTAEWNPAPLNGQKITTKFKLKNAVKHGRWQPVDHDGSWRVDMCSICHRRMHYVDYDQPYQYCPNCGAKMEC